MDEIHILYVFFLSFDAAGTARTVQKRFLKYSLQRAPVTCFLLVVQELQKECQRVQLLLADLSGLGPILLQDLQHPAQRAFIWAHRLAESASALASRDAENEEKGEYALKE